MTLIDSHCHLDFPDFADELDAVVKRARAAGVERMITIGTRPDKAARVAEIAERFDSVFFTVGTHPHEAASEAAEDFAALRDFARHPKCVGIGEAGLDYHYNFAPPEVAQRVFRGQIGLARELKLPIVIHTREAEDDTFALLRERAAGVTVILHCFSAPARVEECVERGYMCSFAGNVTYPKAVELQAAARDLPEELLLVETDSPYLSPQPVRGKPNEPANVVATAQFVAELRGMQYEALDAAVERNAARVFNW